MTHIELIKEKKEVVILDFASENDKTCASIFYRCKKFRKFFHFFERKFTYIGRNFEK